MGDQYAALAIVDASSTGYGAYIRFTDGCIFEIIGGWHGDLRHSAWAARVPGLKIVEWLQGRLPQGARIVVLTDHSAMCHGQLRSGPAPGGFSLAYHLIAFLRTMYSFSADAAAFQIHGPENVANAPSCAARLGSGQLVREVFFTCNFPCWLPISFRFCSSERAPGGMSKCMAPVGRLGL